MLCLRCSVLGLPYAMATLGWVPGVLLLAFVTLESAYAAYLLATLHELRDGRRIKTLRALARETCGESHSETGSSTCTGAMGAEES